MKNIKIIIGVFFISLFSISCNEDSMKDSTSNNNLKFNIEKPDFRDLLVGNNEAKYAPPTIRTESDIVSTISPGCYLVNVRVYVSIDGGQEYQVANDNVQVGDGCDDGNKTFGINKNGSDCSGYLPDGNLVIENNTEDEICLYELLTNNNEAYQQYLITINQY